MKGQQLFEFCRDLLDTNVSSDLADECNDVNYIESLNSTYMFKFRQISKTDEGFSAKVYHKSDMIYKRRAHSLIYFDDFIYAISG